LIFGLSNLTRTYFLFKGGKSFNHLKTVLYASYTQKMYESVEFPSENATLRGRLYNNGAPGKKPVIIMTHGYSGLQSQITICGILT
jgi:hypothetical protein